MTLRTDPETLVAVGIVLAAAAILGFLGRRIRAGETWLIAGYRSSTVDDEAAVARLVGTATVALGAVTAIYALVMLFVEPRRWYWLTYLAVFTGTILFVQLRGRRSEAS